MHVDYVTVNVWECMQQRNLGDEYSAGAASVAGLPNHTEEAAFARL
jgi:hypothetical protein